MQAWVGNGRACQQRHGFDLTVVQDHQRCAMHRSPAGNLVALDPGDVGRSDLIGMDVAQDKLGFRRTLLLARESVLYQRLAFLRQFIGEGGGASRLDLERSFGTVLRSAQASRAWREQTPQPCNKAISSKSSKTCNWTRPPVAGSEISPLILIIRFDLRANRFHLLSRSIAFDGVAILR